MAVPSDPHRAPTRCGRPIARPALALVALTTAWAGCGPAAPSGAAEVLEADQREYRELRRQASEADWILNTRIIPGDTTAASRSQRANEALAAFVGDPERTARLSALLDRPEIAPLERRQVEALLRGAAPYAEGSPGAVRRRIRLENAQIETLFGFEYRVDGGSLTPNEIDRVLRTSREPDRRRAVWEASQEVGTALRPGILRLAELRNASVRAAGYEDFSEFKMRGYDLSRAELLALTERLLDDIWPLYREIHTWARYELAARYGEAVPEHLPAHWLPDRWGQDWSALIESNRAGLDAALADRDPAWIVEEAERFYRSLGFEPLPKGFRKRSSLYPARPDAPYRKNTHASAWHVDLERDVRALMSVESDARWYETTHHELGHIYYYLAYGRHEVPVVLRTGANRALHEAVGSLLGLASLQPAFLRGRGLIEPVPDDDAATRELLREALRYVAFAPWSAGVMTRYEDALYRGELDEGNLNARWWELKRRYQGIVPPGARGERFADAASKTHVTNDPAEYYDYAIAHALLFQLHDRIARDLLDQDPRNTDYFGQRAVGDFLQPILRAGATRPWTALIREATGRDLDGRAMADYFSPLLAWLRDANRGRTHTLPAEAPRP